VRLGETRRGDRAPASTGASGPEAEAATREALEQLRAFGVRRTVLRTALITALARVGGRSTANELTDAVAGLGFVPDHSAVLRTLGDLAERGIVCTVRAGRTARRFGLGAPAHHHAACPRCDTIRSIPAEVLDAPLLAVTRIAEVDPRTAELVVIGVCAVCDEPDDRRRPAP
jgi:Fur family ferric uptake transcriptional regulator